MLNLSVLGSIVFGSDVVSCSSVAVGVPAYRLVFASGDEAVALLDQRGEWQFTASV